MHLAGSHVALLAALCTVLLPIETMRAADAPKLVCVSPVYRFGEKNDTEKVAHAFSLKNAGRSPLIIKKVHGCCGASTKLESKNIEPGSQTRLEVNLSLHGRRGRLQKSIFVASNDPTQPYYRLQFDGIVKKAPTPLTVRPERVDFGVVGKAEAVTQIVHIASSPHETFQIESAKSTNAYINTRIDPVAAGKEYRLSISTVPPLAAGVTRTSVEVVTDHPRMKGMVIPVSFQANSSLVVAPKRVRLLVGDERKVPLTRYVAIRSRKPRRFKILGVDLPDSGMTVETSPLGAWGYRIKIENIVPTADLQGKTLSIHTDAEDMEEIGIPFDVLKRAHAAP